jgi:lysophospholipase L1-like esterase
MRMLLVTTFAAVSVLHASFQTQAPAPAPLPDCPELARAVTDVARSDARLRDWPNLARYREANRTLTSAPQVVFMGDSITDAWQQERFNFFQGKPYADRGISGQTTPQMLVRFRPDVLNLKPKVVVILAGTNDIAGNTGPMTDEEIQGNLASMSELAKAHNVRVILSSITPVSAYHVRPNEPPQTDRRPMARIRAINDWMKRYAAENGHTYLDYFVAMVDENGMLKTELSGDDLHPNAEGYRIMGPLVEAAIQRALR